MSERSETPPSVPGEGDARGSQRPEPPKTGPAPAKREPAPAKREPTPPRREPTPARHQPGVTRAGAVWASVVAGLAVFVLLIVFFIQNQDQVRVRFLGLDGNVPLALALLIAAVAGGIIVAIAGGVRILQLRVTARRAARRTPGA
ncbi:LapA family protein [Sinomonas sp. P47F7]|uniref:LapA family protein n=1 Tax=Sinomonas sp. P47F7 TaxID=3410987 RepID=UPI003BF56966